MLQVARFSVFFHDSSLTGCSVLGILQARILQRIAILFLRDPPNWEIETWVSCITGRFFTVNHHAGGLLVYPKPSYVRFSLGYMIRFIVPLRSQSSLYHCPFLPHLVQALSTSILPSPSGCLCGVAGRDDHTLKKKRESPSTFPP